MRELMILMGRGGGVEETWFKLDFLFRSPHMYVWVSLMLLLL